MPIGTHAKVIAACLSFGGFVVAILVGMWADNPFDVTIGRALQSMAACAVAGYVIGLASEWVIAMRIEQLQREAERVEANAEAGGTTTAA